jgi:3-oxoacyl-[acyl-carrier-protein] synthase II
VTRRVVITGIGAITPIGSGVDGLWQGLRNGKPAARNITRFDPSPFRSHNAAEIDDFDPLHYIDPRKAKRMDRFSQISLAASRLAIDDAGFDPLQHSNGRTTAIFLGTALGGIAFGEEEHTKYVASGLTAVQPSLALSVFGGAGATNVAMEFGIHGPAVGNSNSCASGAIAIGEAFRLIRHGRADAALAGGSEAPLAPLTFGAFALIRAMSRRNDDPAHASRPFDRDRDGFVMGEGSATLVIEELEHALARGARPYAEILGFGSTNDAYHMTAPEPSGIEAARCMTIAIDEAGLAPDEIDYLNAHATSTPLGDAAEALAITIAFGERAQTLPVSGTKGLYGHPLGASGAIEAAITALCIDRNWIPPTTNLCNADPENRLPTLPTTGGDAPIRHAITNAFGFGGINASLVLGKWDG